MNKTSLDIFVEPNYAIQCLQNNFTVVDLVICTAVCHLERSIGFQNKNKNNKNNIKIKMTKKTLRRCEGKA